MENKRIFYAHLDEEKGLCQTVSDHLHNVAKLAEEFGQDAGIPTLCRVAGLSHDLGKYQRKFQDRLKNPNIVCNHSAAGAVVLEMLNSRMEAFYADDPMNVKVIRKYVRVIAYCVACHHGGIRDVIRENGKSYYDLAIENFNYNIEEIIEEGKAEIGELERLIKSDAFREECQKIERFLDRESAPNDVNEESSVLHGAEISRRGFFGSLVFRYLYSVLIDADRIDTILVDPANADYRKTSFVPWEKLASLTDENVARFPLGKLSAIRNEIYTNCRDKGKVSPGIYALDVPTGGGKTLSSLRFAEENARQNGDRRCFFILPYISIIEQNAEVVRRLLKEDGDILTEFHSNFQKEIVYRENGEMDLEKPDIFTETFSNQVVFTTVVGFLESVFSGGTRGIRRFHNMAKSVFIFDEVQALPVKCIGFFNQLTEFLTDFLGSTIVLSSATEPLLHKVKGIKFRLPEPCPIIEKRYPEMRRVEYQCWKEQGTKFENKENVRSSEEVANRIREELKTCESVLAVVNTKSAACKLYDDVAKIFPSNAFHLSTAMCAEHRKDVVGKVKSLLKSGAPVALISTQLIEAGVDLDFGVVFRSVAGLDSIVQAAGRCNREGKREGLGKVILFLYEEENLSRLSDIKLRKNITLELLSRRKDECSELDGAATQREFFENYFDSTDISMEYYVNSNQSLWTLSADNSALRKQACATAEQFKMTPKFFYKEYSQQFETVGKAFSVIDEKNTGVIVRYGKASQRLDQLKKGVSRRILRELQQNAVNVSDDQFSRLEKEGLIRLISGTELYEFIGEYGETGLIERSRREDFDGACLL